jgi:serine/threonine protein kinase
MRASRMDTGGSCGDLLKPGVFREEYIAIVMRELLKGLEYLHGEGKLHRDIKGACLAFYFFAGNTRRAGGRY